MAHNIQDRTPIGDHGRSGGYAAGLSSALLRLTNVVSIVGLAGVGVGILGEILGYPLLRAGGLLSILILAAVVLVLGIASRLLLWNTEPFARTQAIALGLLLMVGVGSIGWVLTGWPLLELAPRNIVGVVFVLVSAMVLWRFAWPGSELSTTRRRITRVYAICCILIVWGVWLILLA